MLFLKKIFRDLKILPLFFKNLNFKSFILFLRYPFLIRRTIVQLGAKYTTSDNKLIMTINENNLSFHINSICNITAIIEIFYEKVYKVNTSQKCIAIDVGMNIGAASAFFALMPNVSKVYAFEPFTETFKQALFNINRNPLIKEKIMALNYGLSNKNETISVPFSFDDSIAMSTTKESIDQLNSAIGKMQSVNIQLRSVSEVLSEIFNENTENKAIILKIDCEGAEYEILESLDKNKLLSNIDFIIIEWHIKGEHELLKILEKYGFISFSRLIYYGLGLIYAVRK